MATRSARTADKSTSDKHARILKVLLLKPGNKHCVDCRRKDPRWASFNLGSFMCIRCSGVHRSMGTHISKVKSIDLDSWTAEQVENMIKWGNDKANKYWEARLPESSIPNENTSGIDPWIRSKYEWKQFASKGPIPDPADLGPIDEAMIADLHGQSGARLRVQMDRSTGSPGSLGIISPPPSTPTRLSTQRPTTSLSVGVHGGDLFSIGQPQQLQEHHNQHQQQRPTPAPQEDFFGLNEPTPTTFSQTSAQNQTQVTNKTSVSPPSAKQYSTGQELFSLNSPPAPAPDGQAAVVSPVHSKSGNPDWKNSIMSLYGNQPSAGNRASTGYSIGQQQQQQYQQPQQRPQSGQFNQGMNSYGYGQQQQQQYEQQRQNSFGLGHQHQQQYQQQQQQQQQQAMWGGNNNNAFGNIQQGGSSFGNGYNSNSGFGGQSYPNTNSSRPTSGNFVNNNSQQGVSQGGDFFNAIASAIKSPTSSFSTQNNKTSSAFGDLTWN